MTRKLAWSLLSATALMAGLSATANATEPPGAVPQRAGIMTDLGHNTSALTYWVQAADGAHVVTTIDAVVGNETASDDGRHAIVRFSALILSGQSQVISVPGPVGSQPQALRIRNLGGRLDAALIEIDRVAQPSMAAETARVTD